jgi:hypothetical protein
VKRKIGNRDADARAATGRRVDLQQPANEENALADAGQPIMPGRGKRSREPGSIKTAAIIGYRDHNVFLAIPQAYIDTARTCVLTGVIDGLLHDAKQRDFDLGAQPAHLTVDAIRYSRCASQRSRLLD